MCTRGSVLSLVLVAALVVPGVHHPARSFGAREKSGAIPGPYMSSVEDADVDPRSLRRPPSHVPQVSGQASSARTPSSSAFPSQRESFSPIHSQFLLGEFL